MKKNPEENPEDSDMYNEVDVVGELITRMSNTLNNFTQEFDVDYPTTIGVLETMKLECYHQYMAALKDINQDDDQEPDSNA